MLNFVTRNADLATSGKLKAKGRIYHPQTIVELRNDLTTRAAETIKLLQAHQNGTFKAPMARRIRNGFRIKIGYGKKNEVFSTGEDLIPEQQFASDRKFAAVAYLEAAIAATNAGEFDALLEAKQADYKKRFEVKGSLEIKENEILPKSEALRLVDAA